MATDRNKTHGDHSECDDSRKGHFGWETFDKIYLPYIIRKTEKYSAVRIVEQKLLHTYFNELHQDLYNCTSVQSFYITNIEARLMNEINNQHCDQEFDEINFTTNDLIVRLSEAQKFQQFLDVCRKKLHQSCSLDDTCGFIRFNSEFVVPYTVRDGKKLVPMFYFDNETQNSKLKLDTLSGWDLAYLRFCCLVQGTQIELFASDTVAVVNLDDIISYFPPNMHFEVYWPTKTFDTRLVLAQKPQNNVFNWTHPNSIQVEVTQKPPKIPFKELMKSKSRIEGILARLTVPPFIYISQQGSKVQSNVKENGAATLPKAADKDRDTNEENRDVNIGRKRRFSSNSDGKVTSKRDKLT